MCLTFTLVHKMRTLNCSPSWFTPKSPPLRRHPSHRSPSSRTSRRSPSSPPTRRSTPCSPTCPPSSPSRSPAGPDGCPRRGGHHQTTLSCRPSPNRANPKTAPCRRRPRESSRARAGSAACLRRSTWRCWLRRRRTGSPRCWKR